ncbi:MAG: leucine-rich repeat domain-containing protein [Crocinitomicaceae bacterium]|jgi:Leucine-rich repeat (LRR) protein|nr:leucine-rich repeat domain-containing protein [Crocinitomicaceae bacterium]MDP4684259.1 leucine-rich repeat domain-containing protein [Crocinitomicaceae bacterium]MDP4798157.1 leucine-rich repeat domain-containing protein [Crocinitomicaceae bacterium]MDP4867205.1 leucine-rich repeat domain-containing protein [Crocinitomicaceae bacterium]MDP5099432.1 leucine-rich repeat domain-containing protein [Crocinitomicaceae bacterium]
MQILFFLIIAIILTSCGAVSPMASNVKLDLSRSGLIQIPAEVFENKELKVLKLFGNQLDSVSSRIGELVNLEELYIGKNNLTTLPKEIGQLKNLKILSLQYNEIDSLPNEIGGLENLETLWLDQNRLISLPDSIGKLKKLKVLQVRFNRLETLPAGLGECEMLSLLYLNRNNLTALPKEMGNLKQLREIYLAGSGALNQIPESFCDLRYLEILEISQSNVLPACLLVLKANRLQIIEH